MRIVNRTELFKRPRARGGDRAPRKSQRGRWGRLPRGKVTAPSRSGLSGRQRTGGGESCVGATKCGRWRQPATALSRGGRSLPVEAAVPVRGSVRYGLGGRDPVGLRPQACSMRQLAQVWCAMEIGSSAALIRLVARADLDERRVLVFSCHSPEGSRRATRRGRCGQSRRA
jgi:hypothetical protein